ncbi:hypothetical protein Tco_1215829 [Tanacetum coccineum]
MVERLRILALPIRSEKNCVLPSTYLDEINDQTLELLTHVERQSVKSRHGSRETLSGLNVVRVKLVLANVNISAIAPLVVGKCVTEVTDNIRVGRKIYCMDWYRMRHIYGAAYEKLCQGLTMIQNSTGFLMEVVVGISIVQRWKHLEDSRLSHFYEY